MNYVSCTPRKIESEEAQNIVEEPEEEDEIQGKIEKINLKELECTELSPESCSFRELLFLAKNNFSGYLKHISRRMHSSSYMAKEEKTISIARALAKHEQKSSVPFDFINKRQEKYKNALRALHKASIFPNTSPPVSIFSNASSTFEMIALTNPIGYRDHVISCLVSDLPQTEQQVKLKRLAYLSFYSKNYQTFRNQGGIGYYYCVLSMIYQFNLIEEPTKEILSEINELKKNKEGCREPRDHSIIKKNPSEYNDLQRRQEEIKVMSEKFSKMTDSDLTYWAKNNFFGFLRDFSECMCPHSHPNERISDTVDLIHLFRRAPDQFSLNPEQKKFEDIIKSLYNASVIPGIKIDKEGFPQERTVSIITSGSKIMEKAARQSPKEYFAHVSQCFFSDFPEQDRGKNLSAMIQEIRMISGHDFYRKYQKIRFFYRALSAIAKTTKIGIPTESSRIRERGDGMNSYLLTHTKEKKISSEEAQRLTNHQNWPRVHEEERFHAPCYNP